VVGTYLGVCPYCISQQENFCGTPIFTAYTRNGGFTTSATADAQYAFPLGEEGSDVALAWFLCAGSIGWCSFVLAGLANSIGL